MAITVIGSPHVGSQGATSSSVTFTATAGSIIIASAAWWSPNGAASGFAFGDGYNTYTIDASTAPGYGYAESWIAHTLNSVSGSLTVTASRTGQTGTLVLSVVELKGCSGTVDQMGTLIAGTSNPTFGNITGLDSGGDYIALVTAVNTNTGTTAAVSGFTNINYATLGSSGQWSSDYEILSKGTTSATIGYTSTNNRVFAACYVTYKAAVLSSAYSNWLPPALNTSMRGLRH